MAAVRCAARRLGGSLLQRTQAAVVEEGRRLTPGRLMRSRLLSSERSQVAERHLLEPSSLMRSRQLSSDSESEIDKIRKKHLQSEFEWTQATLSDSLDKLEELEKKAGPDAFQLRSMSYGHAAKGVAKLTFYFCMITSIIHDAFQAVIKENQ